MSTVTFNCLMGLLFVFAMWIVADIYATRKLRKQLEAENEKARVAYENDKARREGRMPPLHPNCRCMASLAMLGSNFRKGKRHE